MRKLSETELENLNAALHCLKMGELKAICFHLELPVKGQKSNLIQAIMLYLKTGKKVLQTVIPAVSKANPGESYPLAPETKVLAGSYKNDLKTRNFMKGLVGPHFHFTAFGQDWLKARWTEGNPPTYGEFATYWEAERERRAEQGSAPKKEWAYLTFLQNYKKRRPDVTKTDMLKGWKSHREKQLERVKALLGISF